MTKLQEYFHTDWSAMTAADWFGLILTVVVFIVMLVAYLQVLGTMIKFEPGRDYRD